MEICMSYSCLGELVEFEKRTAKRRKQLQNTQVSQQSRLAIAKEAFKSKEDALERLLTYHNTYVDTPAQEVSPTFPTDLNERLDRIEASCKDFLVFRNGLYNQAMRSLRLETQPVMMLGTHQQHLLQQQILQQHQMLQQQYQQQYQRQ